MNLVDRRPVAVSYARFSSGSQAKGTSLERQHQAFALWRESHPEYSSLSYSDSGVSAYSGRNKSKGDLSSILGLIAENKLQVGDVLVIEAMDRLSRQEVAESFQLVLDILRAGVSIITLEDSQHYNRDSLNGSAAFVLIGNLQSAHNYSKRLGNRIRAAHEAKRVQARSHQLPRGLVTVPWIRDGKLFEPFSGLVRRAIELYMKGYGHRAITMDLQRMIDANAELLLRYNRPIHASTIKRWLKSPELVGDWESKDGLIQGLFEPMLTHVEFQQLQTELNRRSIKPSKQRSYLLSGLVICAECFAPFHTRIQKPKPTKDAPTGSTEYAQKRPILYCNCSNYLKNGSCRTNSTWSYDVLLFVLWYGLAAAMQRFGESRPHQTLSLEVERLAKELDEVHAKSMRNESLFEATGKLGYLDKVKELSREMERLEGDIARHRQHQADLADVDVVVRSFDQFNAMGEVEQNSLLKKLEHFIFVDGSKASLGRSFFNPEFEVIRRSQKHGVYIVKVTSDELTPDDDDGEPDSKIDQEDATAGRTVVSGRVSHYFAVGKDGKTNFAEKFQTEDALIRSLESVRDGSLLPMPHLAMFE